MSQTEHIKIDEQLSLEGKKNTQGKRELKNEMIKFHEDGAIITVKRLRYIPGFKPINGPITLQFSEQTFLCPPLGECYGFPWERWPSRGLAPINKSLSANQATAVSSVMSSTFPQPLGERGQ